MGTFKSLFSKFCVIASLSMILTSSAFATGGTITFSLPGGATAVPTLSGTMLVILSLLLFVVAFRIAKHKSSNAGKFFITLLGMTAIVSGSGGIKMISEVSAGGGSSPIVLTGGTFSQNLTSGDYYTFDNDGNPTLTINVEPGEFSSCGPIPISTVTECANGGTLASGATCGVTCDAAASDMRLKKDIKYLAELQNGIKLYSFKYLWDDQTYVGVMAQDLLQDAEFKQAVTQKKDHFYAVYYHMLGLKMITLDQWQESPANIFKL